MDEKIYVVFGSTGEYSDRSEWMVKAFTSLEQAKELVVNAERRAKEIFVVRGSSYSSVKGLNEFDPNMGMDYTGTQYYYDTVELVRPENGQNP